MTTLLGPRRSGVGLTEKPQAVDRPHPEDAGVLLPITIPPAIPSKADDVWRVGKYVFRADFDSANLANVEQGVGPNEFLLQTRRDCGGTENEKATRTWFYFSVSGHSCGELLVLAILNLNQQSRLYSQDYRPVFWSASQPDWQPLRLRVTYRREGDDFQLRFCHRFESDEETLFAFAIPFSYQQNQDMLDHLDDLLPYGAYGAIASAPRAGSDQHAADGELRSEPSQAQADLQAPSPSAAGPRAPSSGAAAPNPGDRSNNPRARTSGRPGSDLSACSSDAGGADGSRVYYRRQLLTHSLEGRRVEVITITDCHGTSSETEPQLPGVFQHDPGPPAAVFRGKTVFFVSSRVHPGETPATHMFNGMLAFLLRRSDPRAAALRRRFVFKLIPLVNPDGVAVGNYRTDTLGQNLNRFYNGVPDVEIRPTVYAIKTLLMYYANQGLLEYYIDLHAHANKKGVFIYGNTLEDGEAHLQSLLYAKLVSVNNASFDFVGCNYTEKNMSKPDKDGASKEGAGRVALYKETGLTHLYTIEANYNTARTLNVVAPASGDHGGRASPPCNKRFPPKFTTGAFHGVGRAFLISVLDMEGTNPWSRLPQSEHRSLEGLRSWLLTMLRATSDTRAAHLPPMSDAVVEVLRGMIASGALRVTAALPTGPGRSRQRSSSMQSFENGPGGHGSVNTSPSSVAFGRTVGRNLSASVQRRPPPPPLSPPTPARRANGCLPVISGSAASGGSAAFVARRSGGRNSFAGTSVEGMTRSSSLPVRNAMAQTARLCISPRGPAGNVLVDREPGSESASASEQAPEEDEPADMPPAAMEAPRDSVDGPSDSDGDDDREEPPARVASPTTSTSSMHAQGPPRFRNLEPSVRISPAHAFKGAAVYCGKVTEFKFPLSDRLAGMHDGALGSAESAMRGFLVGTGAGFSGSVVRSRPSSANGMHRPLSASGSGSGGAISPSPTAIMPPRRSSKGGTPGSLSGLLTSASVNPHHMILPRTMGNGAAVLMTPEQLNGASGSGLGAGGRGRSTLSFARSSSANRRNR